MNSPPNPPVIVVTEERRRRRGLLWVAATAALVIAAGGAGTFALWSDTASFSGGTITAGDLDLHELADTAFYDISSDRKDIKDVDVSVSAPGTPVKLADTTWHAIGAKPDAIAAPTSMQGHTIDSIATWRMVPGDTIAAVQVVQVKLVGDNLVAELTIDGPPTITRGTGDMVWTEDPDAKEGEPTEKREANASGFTSESIKYTYSMYDTAGAPLPDLQHVDLPSGSFVKSHLAYFAAPQTGQAGGADDSGTEQIEGETVTVLPVNADGIADVIVVIEAHFTNVGQRTDVGAADVVDGLKLSLTQLRAADTAHNGTTGIGIQQ